MHSHGEGKVGEPLRTNRRGHGINALVQGLAVCGAAALCSQAWKALGWLSTAQPPRIHTVNGKASDIYPDLDYPLRPALEPWDISTSYPYPRVYKDTVNEGTWLRLTAHPRQEEVVFDMLGDLYCMSLGDSSSSRAQAWPFLSGIPFDKEAEFSADGSQLVYISDSGFGVDNIWTLPFTTCEDMAASGSDKVRESAIQQTNSTFRFFSSPAFHPTEPKIVATKWFLTGRPNGAGEIWEFPLLDTPREDLPERGGRRLVARNLPPSWPASKYQESQLGAEQARYHPINPETVIFTRNVKDDQVGKFTYNKDVHAGINAVFAFDTATGLESELVSAAASAPNRPASPGGANMPRISPDGRTLAFVRRLDDKTVLALKDMRSGTLHYAWDGLTHDLSTIPAFMGAYPSYGWAGDGDAMVIWAEGRIWQIRLKFNELGERITDGEPKLIPFSAKIEIQLGETRHSKNNITDLETSETGLVTSMNGLRSNFEGDEVTFEAAGDTYILNIASEAIVPIAKPRLDQSCLDPSFVQDTHFVMHACWDDRELTSFWLQNTYSRELANIRGLPRGKYVSPIATKEAVAFVRTGKDYMLGDIEETFGEGIWVGSLSLPKHSDANATLSNLRILPGIRATQDTRLSFAGEVLLIQNLQSIMAYDLRTNQYRTTATGKTTVEMTATICSDSRSIAFRDFQHIWLLPHAPQESVIDLWSKPNDSNSPSTLVRLSQIGGHDVTFSGDGKTIFWFLGPEIFFVRLDDVDAACSEAGMQARDTGSCAQSSIQSRGINATYHTALGQQIQASGGIPLAILNATLYPMLASDPGLVLYNATIIIHNGTFRSVGSGSSVPLEPNMHVLDVGGAAVLPGFIDMHAHWGGFLSPYPLASWEMSTFLAYGTTTVHNPSSKNVAGMRERHRVEKGRLYGPRIFHTGDVLYGSTQPNVYTEINSLADAWDALMRVKAEGGDSSFSVKNYQIPSRAARQRLLLAAGELDMLVVPEGGWSFDWGLTYFIDGYTSHEHPLPIPTLYADVLGLVAASGSSYTPLVVMNYGGIFGQHWIHQNEFIPGDKKLRRHVPHAILESLTEVKKAPNSSFQFLDTTLSTAKLAAKGVRTNVGAHGEQPLGHLFHSEMKMMALGGQTPMDVLRHATIGNAMSLGLDGSIGSVQKGKLADLVIYPEGVSSVEEVWEKSGEMKYVVRGATVLHVEDGLVEVWPREGRRQTMPRLNAEDEW